MNACLYTKRLIFCFIVVVLSSLSVIASESTEKPPALAVIVNVKNPLKNASLQELQRMFKLQKQFWPNGDRIVLLLRKVGSTEHHILLDRVYGMDERGLRKYWIQKLFAGDIPSMPSTVKKSQSAIQFVQQTVEAIAVVLGDENIDGVRVLSIDGKLPGQPQYPLVSK